MDILAGLKDKLRFIERFHESASEPFRETKRKITEQEEPFVPAAIDPEMWGGEPPFLAEWIDAEESLDLVGQASLCLVQSAFREYLDGFVSLRGKGKPSGRGNWFGRYRKFFLEVYSIDWGAAPIQPEQLEEISLARNDIQHTGEEFGMVRRQSKEHARRFPGGLFASEIDKELFRESKDPWPARISVSGDTLSEAVRRVERFCEFLDSKRTWS